MNYGWQQIEVRKTAIFDRWLSNVKDMRAVARILVRIDRLAQGNAGDARSIGSGLSELRIDHGPGYRVYYLRHAETVVLLLCGGDKSTQSRDITRAHELANDWRGRHHEG